MSDTIELLEAIGQNASLRHATADELDGHLAQAGASGPLRAAASSADASPLTAELGPKTMYTPQSSQTFHEGDGMEEQEPEPLPSPDPDQPLPQS